MAGYFNAGQDCTAATRVLCSAAVYKDFVAALTEQAKATQCGMPDNEDVLFGPVNNASQLARVSGFFDRLPELKLITHHCGGMLPYFGGRAETLWAQMGSRSADGNEANVLKSLQKAPIDYFKMFYGDTVLGGSASALRCGLDFFGPDHVVFASDCPFDPEEGPMFIREGIRSIEDLNLPVEDARKIYFGNAFKLLGRKNA